MGKKHFSEKTFGHERGLSCCFRQWRSDSHCNLLHGYAISVKLEFSADQLDHRNWVVDFGSMKLVKEWLESMFDHKLLVAEDDPQKDEICMLAGLGIADVHVVDNVGCEAFAEMIYTYVNTWLYTQRLKPRVSLDKVTVKEHAGNGASYSQWSEK
ncbi:putative queuosine biosynthesis protein [Pseudomonas phage MiCath]|uniref:Queuosine biosynthesis protein n=1 Tax=Pseudomonas phage MiCath TaxID=3003729 RepID=A0AAF0AGZ0_9CAUD|nr:putative queuosine biosynthesis protein [Pseudomonas phage MiCath]WAX22409.1 putative queuosine biosynthesis protein [Pseudomonas phage MiCath]